MKGLTAEARLAATVRHGVPHVQGARYWSLITVGKGFPAISLHSLKSKTAAAKKASFHSGYNVFLISLRITSAEGGGMDHRQGTRRHAQVFTDVLFRGNYLPSVKAVNAVVF